MFDGWGEKAVGSAAAQNGVDRSKALLAMPKSKAALVDAYIQGVDRELEQRCPPSEIAAMKIRTRIRTLVWTRLEIMGPAREAVRSGLAILAMPQNIPLGARAGWRSADQMWRLAGDTSTDFNHYTKRATLGAVYGSTLLAGSTTIARVGPPRPLSLTAGSTTSFASRSGKATGDGR